MQKLVINAAITGMVPAKNDNPNVPITVDEIIADVKRCRDAGASIVHLHARYPDQTAAFEANIYSEIYSRVRQECPDILISGSTSGRVFKQFEQRCQAIRPAEKIKPDFASLTLGSLNFPHHASINEPQMIKDLAAAMYENGVVPEWECFDVGMIDFAVYLLEKGILKRPIYCNLFLGSLGTLSAKTENLVALVRALPDDATWSAAGIGRYQSFVNNLAVAMGGHVRVGLEDNLFFDAEKRYPASNAGLIERVVNVARAVGREIATPDEARSIIGLPARVSTHTVGSAVSATASN